MADLFEGDVKLPVVGETKKAYVAVGLAVIAGVAGYAYWRRAAGAGETAADEELSYYADTRTGSPDDVVGTSPGGGGGGSGGGSGWDDADEPPDTNQEWTAAVMAALTHYEPGYLSSILGKYLGRQPLTTVEAGVIREAWAAVGQPPEGNYVIIPTTDTSNPGGGTGTVPGKPGQFRQGETSETWANVAWGAVTGAQSYTVFKDGAEQGSTAETWFRVTGMGAGSTHTVGVAANNSSGRGEIGTTTVKTKAGSAPGNPPPAAAPKQYVTQVVLGPGHGWQSSFASIAGHFGKTQSHLWNLDKNQPLRRKYNHYNKITKGDLVYIDTIVK